MRDPKTGYALVFDVNVLIDAVDASSKRHDAAADALSVTMGMPVYYSDHMLITTHHELLRLGADPQVARDFLEFISTPQIEYGPKPHAFRYIDFHEYDIYDRYGNPDKEDTTIVSLMDATEKHARKPALLVTGDAGLQQWCLDNRRDVVFPSSLPRFLNTHPDPVQTSTFDYTARQMFPHGVQHPRLPSTNELRSTAKNAVRDIRVQRPERPSYTPSIDIDYGDDQPSQFDR